MLDKKTVKNILLEVESSCYNYEKYLQEIVSGALNNNSNDIKYLIVRENDNGYLTLYKYSESDFISWLYLNGANNMNINDLISIYEIMAGYAQNNYIDYYIEDNITNFINISKFRNMLYNNKSLLQKVINNIYTNICNCKDNNYLIYEYNLNKKLYHELKKIQMEVK